jgi:diguanylate cyclase (GGDEF)-like protein
VRTALLAAALYAAGAQLVISATSFGTSAGSTFWPGAGVTLAFLLRTERGTWPYILAAVALTEGLVDVVNGFGGQLAVGWAVANTSEAWLGATLIRRHAAGPLRTVGSLQRFVLGGVVAGPLLGAVLGTLWAHLVVGDPVWPRLPRWFVGDAIGALVVAPVLLSAGLRRTRHRDRSRTGGVLLAALAVTVVGVGPWAFPAHWGLPFLVLSVVVLLSVRLDPARAALVSLVVAATVEAVTALGRGPFAEEGVFEGLVVAQMFVASCAFAVLLVSSLTQDLVSREALADALRAQAQHDPLTGAGNRRLLEERYDRSRAQTPPRHQLVGLLVIDLDDFKEVNDRFGHQAGDTVLVETARRLQEAVRDGDTVARVGGDEFAVLLDGVSSAAVTAELAERVRRGVRAPVPWKNGTLEVRASVGAATSAGGEDDLDALLARADAEMYLAKHQLPPRPREEPSRDAQASPS